MKESETLELKKSLAQLKEGIISLGSMLNKKNKGIVYFGINDDGKVFGIDVGKKTIADITHEIQNNLKPLPIKVEINTEIMSNKQVIKVTVEGDDTPYSSYGRYYIRVNDSDIIMHSSELQHYFKSKEGVYLKWEEKDSGYTVDDVNEELLIDCFRKANDNGRLEYTYKNINDALTKLNLLVDNGNLNNAGYYLFSNKKPLTIKEANYPTDSRVEFGEIKQFKGNIFECINESINYIQNHLSYKSNIIGITRQEVPEIPLRAIREIVINSYAHCSYAIKGDFNEYSIYKSSIRIYNPGTIIKEIDPKKFASGKVGSKIRNPHICDVLYKCGLIDAFGTGFDRTFSLCADNNIEYKYNNDEFGFTFIFERNINYLNDRINDRINLLDKNIIKLIKEDKYITTEELSLKTGKSIPTIARHLKQLSSNNIIERIGSRKTGYYKVNK